MIVMSASTCFHFHLGMMQFGAGSGLGGAYFLDAGTPGKIHLQEGTVCWSKVRKKSS